LKLKEFDVSIIEKYQPDELIGVDEVGRGPIAGPVVACACIISKNSIDKLANVADSKKLSPKKRVLVYDELKACGTKSAVSFVSPEEIDRTNILKATFKAMELSISKLKVSKNALVLIDGNLTLPNLKLKQIAITGGDNKSLAIASASIIAKVNRDEYMEKMAKIYPGYGFEKHKGYGTDFHYKALEKLGPCPLHRRSFLSLWHCIAK